MSRQIFTTIFTGCSAIWGMSVAFAQVPAPAGNDPRMVQAGALEDQAELNKRLRNQRVRLTADGTLTGRVSSVAGAGVTPLGNFAMTLVQFGEVRGRATSDADGNFRMKSIRPGIYSMIGASASGYLCYGVEVVAADAIIGVLSERAPDKAVPVAFQEVRNDVEIDTLTVPPRDFPAVGELIRGYLPPGLTDLDVNRARVMSAERRDIQLPEEGLKLQPENAALRYHQVQVVDGAVTGRMRRIHPTTGRPQRIRRLNVFLVRDGRVVSQAPVAESGFFTLKNVSPGMHSVVGVGVEGLAAFSVELVDGAGGGVADVPRELQLGFVSAAGGGAFGDSLTTTDPRSTGLAGQVGKNPAGGPEPGTKPGTGEGSGEGGGEGGAGDGGGGNPSTGSGGGGGGSPSGGGGTSGLGGGGSLPGGGGLLPLLLAGALAGIGYAAGRRNKKGSNR